MAESTRNEKIKPEKYLDVQLRMLIWTGLNRPFDSHPIINLLFILRGIFSFATYSVLMIGCIAHMKIVNKYDLLASSINVLQLIIYAMGVLHVLYYQIRNEAVHSLITKAREVFRFSSNTGHFTMDEPTRVDRRKSVGWTLLCSLAATCWFVLAMARGDDPVPVWAPMDLRKSPYFEIDTVLQFTGQLMIGNHSGCFGSFYMSVLSLVRYQFDLLACSLEHVGPLAVLKTRRRVNGERDEISGKIASNDGSSETKSSNQCECCTEEFKRFFRTFEKRRLENALTHSEERIYEEELYDTLKDCVVHHQNILQLGNVIEDFFGPVILVRLIFSTMMMCFTIYSTSKFTSQENFTPIDMTFLSLVEYYIVAIAEQFIFCYIADALLHTSLTIPNVAFERLPWHGGRVTKKLISTLKIFHLSAKKPTGLKTPFYVVSLDILRAMLRASFSFYTLLRSLQSK